MERMRSDAAARHLLNQLLGQPVITVNQVAQLLGVSFPAANSAVSALQQRDILRELPQHPGRSRVFNAHEVSDRLSRP